MKKLVYPLVAALCALSCQAREIVLLEGPFEADWSDKHCVDPMQMVGVAPGDVIHVHTSNVKDYAVAYIRTKSNGVVLDIAGKLEIGRASCRERV